MSVFSERSIDLLSDTGSRGPVSFDQGDISMRHHALALLLAATPLTACQSTGESTTQTGVQQQEFAAGADTAGAGSKCSINLAGGPPSRPAKGADFGKAAAKNVGKNVSRSLISNIGSRVAGPLGGAVAGGLAANSIRQEQDLSGKWTATDGAAQGCGCSIEIRSATNLNLETSNNGRIKSIDCSNPMLAEISRWKLGHSFTGYDAKFELLGKDRKSVLATLNRDGVNYFSGTLADGTPVTLWRRGG